MEHRLWAFENSTVTPGMQCIRPYINVHGLTLYNPFLIPLLVIGISIGLYGFTSIRSRFMHARGAVVYSTMFLFYIGMNFSAIFADVLFPSAWTTGFHSSAVSDFFALSDAYFSTAVNCSFALCALVDLGILKERSPLFKGVLVVMLVAIGVGYHFAFWGDWKDGFHVLYLQLAKYGFGLFLLSNVFYVARNRDVLFQGLLVVAFAIISALLGIAANAATAFFCYHTAWINSEVVWFFFSHTTLISCYLFFRVTLQTRERLTKADEAETHEVLLENRV